MFKDFPLIKESKKTITQFYPHIPKTAGKAVQKVFNGRWIGQGPLVDKLEMIFSKKFAANLPSVAVGSGTDALHLAYILSNLKKMMKLFVLFSLARQQTYLFYISGQKLNLRILIPKHSI